MKTADARDAMVKRVNDAHQKYPKFADLPETEGGKADVYESPNGSSEAEYISCLYRVCAKAIPVGRRGQAIVGKPL